MKGDNNKNLRKRGFSLIEILVAITFLGIGLVGVLSFFSSSVKSNSEAKNELVASGLAQEACELVRNYAEYKKLHDHQTWSQIVADLAEPSPSCRNIDYRSLSSHSCNNGNAFVCFSGGLYQQCDSGTSNIRRTISISNGGSNGLIVTATVVWNGKTTTATDRLYQNDF